MGKKPKFGVITKPLRDKPRKRPGRHTKRLNKHKKRQLKKYPYYVQKQGETYSYKFPAELPLYYGLKSICQNNKGD